MIFLGLGLTTLAMNFLASEVWRTLPAIRKHWSAGDIRRAGAATRAALVGLCGLGFALVAFAQMVFVIAAP